MTLAQKEPKQKAEVEEQVSELLSSHFKYGNKWIISNEMRTALSIDSYRFYEKLGELKLDKNARLLLAVEMSLDNNKCAVNALSWKINDEYVKIEFGDIQKAREITGIKRVKPAEYVDSLVSMLVRSPSVKLDEKKSKEINEIAKETLAMYGERKKSTATPVFISAAAVYYASFKVDNPIFSEMFGVILGMSERTVRNISEDLVRVTRPEEFSEWKKRKDKIQWMRDEETGRFSSRNL